MNRTKYTHSSYVIRRFFFRRIFLQAKTVDLFQKVKRKNVIEWRMNCLSVWRSQSHRMAWEFDENRLKENGISSSIFGSCERKEKKTTHNQMDSWKQLTQTVQYVTRFYQNAQKKMAGRYILIPLSMAHWRMLNVAHNNGSVSVPTVCAAISNEAI